MFAPPASGSGSFPHHETEAPRSRMIPVGVATENNKKQQKTTLNLAIPCHTLPYQDNPFQLGAPNEHVRPLLVQELAMMSRNVTDCSTCSTIWKLIHQPGNFENLPTSLVVSFFESSCAQLPVNLVSAGENGPFFINCLGENDSWNGNPFLAEAMGKILLRIEARLVWVPGSSPT